MAETLEEWMATAEKVVISSLALVSLRQVDRIKKFGAIIVRRHPLLNCSGRVERRLEFACQKAWAVARIDLMNRLFDEKEVIRVRLAAAWLPGDVELKKCITIRFVGIYQECVRKHDLIFRGMTKNFVALGVRGIRLLLKIEQEVSATLLKIL